MNSLLEKYGELTVALLSAILFLPFLGDVHLFDWDEINFAESAREMLITGEYFRVQINFQPFWEKPPLFFWLQAGSMKLFGINEFAARFPNAICGIITLTSIFRIGKKHFNVELGMWWVLFMAGSFTPFLYFKSGIIDPWFNLFIFSAIYQLFLACINDNTEYLSKRFMLAGVFSGLAVLTKGPVAVLIIALCTVIWIMTNRFRIFFSLRLFVMAFVPFLLISSLWVVSEVSKNGITVIKDFLSYQIDLFKNPVAGHGQPLWYHPVVLLLGCFPSSIFAFRGFNAIIKSGHQSPTQLKKWMAILFWVVLILFSLVKTKIVHYSSLCYLPLTFMAALGTDMQIKSLRKFSNGTIITTLLLGSIIAVTLGGITLIDSYKAAIIPYIKDEFAVASLQIQGPWNGYEFILGFIFLMILISSVIRLLQNRAERGLMLLLCSTALFISFYLYLIVPKIEAYSQQPAILFYEQLKGKDCYVESLGHKSYAQYFYAQVQPQKNANYTDKDWLLHGKIDKPVYFVVKLNHSKEYLSNDIMELARKGGFALLLRKPNSQ